MAGIFGSSFKPERLKSNLKMASQRITLLSQKMENQVRRQKAEIARLLEQGKEEKARIRVEHVIRDDLTMEAYELVELLCETVVARMALIRAERECPFDMRQSVCSLIYAANRTEVPELKEVQKQFKAKYGKEFVKAALRNVDGCVNERLINKLSIQPPNAFLVLNYMKEIARQYEVDWAPDDPDGGGLGPSAPPTGASVQPGAASGFGHLYTDGRDGGMPIAPAAVVTASVVAAEGIGGIKPGVYPSFEGGGGGGAAATAAPIAPVVNVLPAPVAAPAAAPAAPPPAWTPPTAEVASPVTDVSDLPPPAPGQGGALAPAAPTGASGTAGGDGDDLDFDALTARFNALRG